VSDLDIVEFADNPDPRCPCVLLLDTSSSMDGQPIGALNEGLRVFQTDIQSDALAQRRSEIALVTFGNGGVRVLDYASGDLVPASRGNLPKQSFTIARDFHAPTLTADGYTPMGEAIHVALDLIQSRKTEYKRNGVAYYRPWVFMVTDGLPTDSWSGSALRVHEEVRLGGVVFFAVGVPPEADFELLAQITTPERPPVELHALHFSEMFAWLSQSQKRTSAGTAGGQVALPPISGWGSVPL
jgi:uncharacterized protein YegL